MDDATKIKCITKYTYRNKKTGEIYKDKVERPDIVVDCEVTVDPKNSDLLQKVMNNDNKSTT